LVYVEDRPSLAALLSGARAAAAAATPSEAYIRVRHSDGKPEGGAAEGGAGAEEEETEAQAVFTPVEMKACGDCTYVYVVMLDARMPARLEGLLPDFLLSTSARARQRSARENVCKKRIIQPHHSDAPHIFAALRAGHDLRTPACSIQAATTLLGAFPAVASDGEAVSLLRSIDAACSVLLRVVHDVLSMRALQRDGALPLKPPRAFDPRAVVARVVGTVCDFDGVPPRVAWASEPLPPLPPRVIADEDALEACLQNVLLAAVRLGAWLPTQAPVRVAVEAQPAQAGELAQVLLHVTAERTPQHSDASSVASGSGSDESLPHDAHAFVLVITAETPGRPLSPDECDAIMAPFGLIPADKGGGTGLGLCVARGVARAMGGELELECGREEGTCIQVRVPLRVPEPELLRQLNLAPSPEQVRAAQAAARAQREQRAEAQRAQPPPPHAPPLQPLPHHAPETPREVGAAAAAAAAASGAHLSREALSEVQLTARMFECLLTNSDDVFAICRISAQVPNDPASPISSIIEYISPAVTRRLAFAPAAVVGRDLVDVCHPEDKDSFRSAVRAAYRGEGPQARQLLLMHRSMTATGAFIWCHSAGLCQGDLLFLVCRDVRVRKSVEVALRAFALATSHDMREPCNAILVSAAVLERRECVAASGGGAGAEAAGSEDPFSASAAAASASASIGIAAAAHAAADDLDPAALVACIRASCALILGIIGNVLTAPQVQEGALTLQTEVFSPAEKIHDVIQACRMGAAAMGRAGGSSIALEAPPPGAPPLPALVETDMCRLAQVVQNCVTNALKFAEGTPVTVRIALEPPEAHPPPPPPVAPGRPWLSVAVRDRGRGMTPEQAAACFQAGTAAPTSVGGGTGLGLYISHAFAQLMGGSLVVDSSLGEGSTFTLRVPVRVLNAEETASVAAAHAAAAQAARAERARSAAARADAAAADAAARAAEGVHEDKRPRTPSRERGAAAGAQSRQRHCPFHILVADDHPLNLRLITRLLQLHGFDVTPVPDGGAALAALLSSYGAAPGGTSAAGGGGGVSAAAPPASTTAGPFDLAILDMIMPIKSGTQAASEFRAWEAAARPGAMRLPIIALTANVLEEHASECENAGMVRARQSGRCCFCHSCAHALMCLPVQDLFLSKPLREDVIPVLRAHAAAYAEQRAVEEAARAATAEAGHAAAAAAAAAAVAHAVFGPPGLPGGAGGTAGSPRERRRDEPPLPPWARER
jgi:signal transduction histidine kinase